MILTAIVIAVVLATIQSSFFEWTLHKFWLHRPTVPKDAFRAHTLVHHQLCKFEDTFHVTEKEQEEALTFTWWGGPLVILINQVPWWIAASILYGFGINLPYLPFLAAYAITTGLYYAGYEGLHYLMHKPSIPVIERTRFFQFIKKHHLIHHVQMDRNLNVLLPIADTLLGTLVLERPAGAPLKTTDAARRTARQHSNRNKAAKAPASPAVEPKEPAKADL